MLHIGHAVVAHELADLAVIQPDEIRSGWSLVNKLVADLIKHLNETASSAKAGF